MTSAFAGDPAVAAPPWRRIELPELGPIEVRDSGPLHGSGNGSADGPTILLLHGWTASTDLNWCRTYEPLARWRDGQIRIVTWDHRAHGARGLRTGTTALIDDLADDTAAIAGALGIERAIVVGYSMGGAVAQATWRRHPDLVAGLVLGATAARFGVSDGQRQDFTLMDRGIGPARLLESVGCSALAWRAVRWFGDRHAGRAATDDASFDDWAWSETRSGVLSRVLAVGHDLGGFDATDWLCEVDVPHAVLVCNDDDIVPTVRQRELVDALPAPFVYEMATDHAACVLRPDLFIPALTAALDEVTAAR